MVYLFIFSVSCICLIICFTIAYAVVKKKKTLSYGTIAYTRPSSALLYTSLCFSSFCIIGFLICIIMYVRIFSWLPLHGLGIILYTAFLLSIVSMGINIYYLLRPSKCQDGYLYSDSYKKCIPNCGQGSVFDVQTNTCRPGCGSSEDCDGKVCVNNQCCRLHTDIDCNGQCCSPIDCQQGTLCCSTDKVCNGACCGDIGQCVDDSCRVYCPKGLKTCNAGEACFSVDQSSDDPAFINFFKKYPDAVVNDGKAYVCAALSKNCQPDSVPQFLPQSVGFSRTFYPALGLPSSSNNILLMIFLPILMMARKMILRIKLPIHFTKTIPTLDTSVLIVEIYRLLFVSFLNDIIVLVLAMEENVVLMHVSMTPIQD